MSTEPAKPSADDILAMLTSEFGKKPAKAAKPAQPKKVAGTATDTATARHLAETSEANRIARLMSPQSPWRATALVAHTVEQRCRCCGGSAEIIGNILIRHTHKVTGATWDCLMPESPAHATLPREIFPHVQEVEQCPACLRMEFRQSPLPRTRAVQFGLFTKESQA